MQLRFSVTSGPANTLNELLIGNLRQEPRRRDVERRYRTSRRLRGRHKFDRVRLTLLRLGDSKIRARNVPPRPNRLASFGSKQSLNGPQSLTTIAGSCRGHNLKSEMPCSAAWSTEARARLPLEPQDQAVRGVQIRFWFELLGGTSLE